MEKQTTAEWLFKQLWEEPKDKMVWYAILKKAKEMEKEQAERMYSEEEVYNLLCKLPNYFKMTIPQQTQARKDWFEQFKKK